MKKLVIESRIGGYINIDTDYGYFNSDNKGYGIAKLISELQKLEIQGATHVKIDGEIEWDTSNIENIDIIGVKYEEESDEAFEKRRQDNIIKEEAKKKIKKAKEMELYNELKLKYEKE